MTCSRHYTPAAAADLQQIAANIEAERRRKYRAEMAQELREALHLRISLFSALPEVLGFDYVTGLINGLIIVLRKIDELSPPTVCDGTE